MIAMTMMIRDEADIVKAMVEHHLAQGIEIFLVTDNGSIDGTAEILETYASDGRIHLFHDPVHRKQQHEVVTRMSRRAALAGATWVLNADADEFWCAKTPGRTVAEELAGIDTAIGAFEVPVHDMTGAPAAAGSGLQRLVYRDDRPVDLMRELGINAHATSDVAFVADPDVEVAQGNHFVNVRATGTLGPDQGLEVLHFPWRSWEQFSRKVENAGRAYEQSPNLQPSLNHHGMRDYRRMRDGLLFASYVARHPSAEQLEEGVARGWLTRDERIAGGTPSPIADVPLDPTVIESERALIERLRPMEQRLEELERLHRRADDIAVFETRHVAELDVLVAELRDEIGSLQQANGELTVTLRALEARWYNRAAHAASRARDRLRPRGS